MSEATAGALRMRLVEIRYAAEGINLFRFAPIARDPLPRAEPGAHIGVILPGGLERQYSVTSCDDPDSYVVGIKREAGGRGGSRSIHDTLRVGHEVLIAPPRNNFPLCAGAVPVVLFAGGIGITPIHAMIERLERDARAWTLHYACRNRAEMAFRDALGAFPQAQLHFDEEAGGVLPIAALVAGAPAGAQLYCCGPAPMLKAFESACAGRDPDTVHVEYFEQRYAADTAGGFTIELARSGGSYPVPAGKTILAVLREAGIAIDSSCEEGVCGSCETRVIAGTPDHRDAILTERERREGRTMMVCCSGALGDRLVLDL